MISVLYVDDDLSLLDIGKLFLERMGEFRVELRDSAQNALHLLSATSFDIIISDFEMPDMDGLEFLKTVRDQYGEIPFILFTGRGREEVVIRALNNGADYYVQKGGEPQAQFVELAHKVRLAVQRRNADIALRESEKRYRDVVEMQTEFICRHTPDGRTVFVNEAFCRYFGIKRDETLGKVIIRKILEVDQERVISQYLSLTRENPTGEVEFRVMMPDGSIRWQGWRNCAVFSDEGRLIEYQSVGNDITEQKNAIRELEETKNQYQAIFDNTGAATIIVEEDTTIVCANAEFARLCGETTAEIEHKRSWTEFVVPEDLKRIKGYHLDRRSDPAEVPRVYEFRFYDRNGAIRYGLNTVSMIPGTNRSVASILDITDRIDAEKTYHSIFDTIQDVFYRTDTNGRSVLFSPSVADVLGYESASELDGVDIATRFYQNPEERNAFLAEIEKNGSVSNYEVKVKKKDGTPITVLSSSHQYYDATGNFLGIEGILRDITGFKQAEKDLKKTEEMFRELEAQLPDYVLIHEGETITFVNKEGARYGGQSQQEVIGRSIFSFTAPEYHDLLREKYALRYQNIEIEPYDVEVILPTGERRWVVVRSTTLMNREKETTLTVLTDITERKRAEAALVQANRKLSLLTDITRHDTSNQLMALQGYLSILNECMPDSHLSEYVRKATTTSERINSIIQFTRQYGEIGTLSPIWQSIHQVADKASVQLSSITLMIENDLPEDIEIFADPMVMKILYNLMENSIRHGKTSTHFRFNVEDRSGDLVIICEDNGVGIPEGEKERIFERGFGTNTGIGLTMCREILSLTDILISEQGTPGKGARFEIRIPRKGWRKRTKISPI